MSSSIVQLHFFCCCGVGCFISFKIMAILQAFRYSCSIHLREARSSCETRLITVHDLGISVIMCDVLCVNYTITTCTWREREGWKINLMFYISASTNISKQTKEHNSSHTFSLGEEARDKLLIKKQWSGTNRLHNQSNYRAPLNGWDR